MANFEAVTAVKWNTVNGRNVPDFNVSLQEGEGWVDMVGNFPPAPIYIIGAKINTAARLQALNGLPGVIVLAWREVDDGGDVLQGNFSDQPTTQQLQTLGQLILNTFPGTDADTLRDAGRDILEAGLTRREIIQKLITRFKRLV